jgi:hypothetical protein
METNIWKLSKDETRALPFGSRVIAGVDGEKGTFLGVRSTGIVVVAWDGYKGLKDPQIMSRIMAYALT